MVLCYKCVDMHDAVLMECFVSSCVLCTHDGTVINNVHSIHDIERN